MAFKEVEELNPIGAIKTFPKPKFNLYMEELITTPKSYGTNMSGL